MKVWKVREVPGSVVKHPETNEPLRIGDSCELPETMWRCFTRLGLSTTAPKAEAEKPKRSRLRKET